MGMQWTKEQRQVIDLRNCNILVSAAAGSGKTATLVERIIQRITEGEAPLDIDQLLVVTFTRAAAAEMRERIGDAIERLRLEEPENQHLKKQSLLLHSAQITTIDSFCLSVIQDYFHEIDLDPVFRIAEEEELTLLQHDVVMEVLEEEYEKGQEDFLSFAQVYGGKHQDLNLEGYILKLYRFSESCPWPEEWLSEMAEADVTGVHLKEEPWLEGLFRITKGQLEECIQMNEKAQEICGHPDGPYTYIDALQSDKELLAGLLSCKDYEEALHRFQELKFTALSRKSMKECSAEKKEQVKALREQVKDCLGRLKKDFYFQSLEEMEADWRKAFVPAKVLIRLTLAFHQRYAEKKTDRRILDFSDIEHFALKILVEEKDGTLVARTAAKELRRQFVEIMIDEYQDSNEVQETILKSISREEEGHPNIFMVGDVKQSIYRFRLAKPELFLEKYNTYEKVSEVGEEGSLCRRIDLRQNFRSRSEVLAGANELFYKIMGRHFGQIEYDADAALYPGAEYLPRQGAARDNQMELVLLDEREATEAFMDSSMEESMEKSMEGSMEKSTEGSMDSSIKKSMEQSAEAGSRQMQESEVSEEQREYNEKELEALQCARMVQELVNSGFTIQGRDADGKPYLRGCEYRDIVILLRTMSGWSEIFAQVFAEQGVPAAATTQSGYFNVPEIKWLLNYLRLLDNPQQDIPAASVLLSPFVGLTHDELAGIRIESPERSGIYDGALWYEKNGKKEAVRQKLTLFLDIFHKIRERSGILTVPELLAQIYDLTAYDSYVAAMPSGTKRYSNLLMFSEKAAAFERSSYRGLFQFIRYVERLIRYEVDYGEAAQLGENSNAVRIMSIHKSKGLEFPVVFLCGTTKKFNLMDLREKIIFHPEQGIALDFIDETMRTTVPTLKKKMLQSMILEETLSEELRLLYVAMTRAKEKLILTGYVKDYEKMQQKWESKNSREGEKLYYTVLQQAACYMDFIGPALSELSACDVRTVEISELYQYRQERETEKSHKMQEFLSPDFSKLPIDLELKRKIREYLIFSYPYEEERFLPVKTSVSELKKKAFTEEEFEVPDLVPALGEEEKDSPKAEEVHFPEFLKEKQELKGADRGTLYHKILECIPLTNDLGKAKIKEELKRLSQEGKIQEKDLGKVDISRLEKFYAGQAAARMRKAEAQGKLYREQPFVLAVPAGDIYEIDSKEPVLIQGIIDVFFEEEGGLVLLDYKTDYVPGDGEAVLIQRYAKQLALYQRALEEITGKKVKEKIIYSFYLQKEILVP